MITEWFEVTGTTCPVCDPGGTNPGVVLYSDGQHTPVCPECGYEAAGLFLCKACGTQYNTRDAAAKCCAGSRTRIMPQPEYFVSGDYWLCEGDVFVSNEDMQSHLLHDVYGNMDTDAVVKPVLIDGVWYWELEEVPPLEVSP